MGDFRVRVRVRTRVRARGSVRDNPNPNPGPGPSPSPTLTCGGMSCVTGLALVHVLSAAVLPVRVWARAPGLVRVRAFRVGVRAFRVRVRARGSARRCCR